MLACGFGGLAFRCCFADCCLFVDIAGFACLFGYVVFWCFLLELRVVCVFSFWMLVIVFIA